jgi:hypothetical protein
LDARRVAKLYAVEPWAFSVNLCAYYACSCCEAFISSFVLKEGKDNIQLSAVEDSRWHIDTSAARTTSAAITRQRFNALTIHAFLRPLTSDF